MIEVMYYRAKIVCDVCQEKSLLAEPHKLAGLAQEDATSLAKRQRWLVKEINHREIAICPDCMMRALFAGVLKPL